MRPLTEPQRLALFAFLVGEGVLTKTGRGDWGVDGAIRSVTMNSLARLGYVELFGGGPRITPGDVAVHTYVSHDRARLTDPGREVVRREMEAEAAKNDRFEIGERVTTPLGSGRVVFQRMAPPTYARPEAVSVKLDVKAFEPGYKGTVFNVGVVVKTARKA